MKIKEKHLKCKNCPYYSGVQCHGHGEFWGDCKLMYPVYDLIYKYNVEDNIYPRGYWLQDDDICIFIKNKGDN